MTRSLRWLWAVIGLVLMVGCSTLTDLKNFGYQLRYRGNESFADFRLTRVVEDLLLDFGRDPETEAPILDAAQDLADFYLDEGFPDAEVSYEIERGPDLSVTFVVAEGPRVTLDTPVITGNENVPLNELLALWNRTKSGFLAMGDPYYVESDLRGFGISMRERYYARGYLDAEIEGPVIDREVGGGEARVSYRIIEGTQFTLASLSISEPLRAAGVPDVGAEIVGKPFSTQKVQAARLRAREALSNIGYYDPRIKLDINTDRDGKTVSAEISGEPGERVRIVGYKVNGLDRSSISVVEGEIEFEVGQWYSGQAVEKTIRELYRTGVFEGVQVEERKVADGEVELDINVQEIEAKEVSVLAGWGSYEQLRGGVFYTDRNLFGSGHQLRAGVRASMKGYGTNVTWTEPTLFHSDTALSVTGFFREREEPTFTDQSFGFSAALSRRLFADMQGRLGYSLTSRDGFNIDSVAQLFDNEFVAGTVFTELSYDKRSSVIYPESGHREFIKFEFADENLGGTVNFVRLTAGVSWFFPIAEKVTLGLNYDTGLIWWLDDTQVPVQERFYNGGFNTVRSFRQYQLGPRDPITGQPLGGEFRNVLNAELRFPIVALLQGAVFADAGNVGLLVEDFSWRDLSYGLGGGLRLNLPIGPVRVDAGWNPDPKPEERDYSVHFSVGFPF